MVMPQRDVDCVVAQRDVDHVVGLAIVDADRHHAFGAQALLAWMTEMPEPVLKQAVDVLVQVNDDEARAAFVQRALIIKQATECEQPLRRRLI